MHCLIYTIRQKARKSSVVQANYKVALVQNITNSLSLVTNYESCLTCQHFISNRTNHKLRKKLAHRNDIGMGRTWGKFSLFVGLKNHENSKPRLEEKTFSPTERVASVGLIVFALTH